MTISLSTGLFDRLNEVKKHRANFPTFGSGGLSTSDLDAIEDQLNFKLPQDLRMLLQNLHDPHESFFPWRNFDIIDYHKSIERIISGIEFDIEHNSTWLARWGNRPDNLIEAKSIMREDFVNWPRLVPICGHRYLAVDPCLENNPIFSIWQTDIICYGANLEAYLANEFIAQSASPEDWTPIREIPIWHDFAFQTEGFLAS